MLFFFFFIGDGSQGTNINKESVSKCIVILESNLKEISGLNNDDIKTMDSQNISTHYSMK